MSSLPNNPDVIVIGAGTSGLSAAKELKSAGLDTLVLESSDHVGGRCITDTTTFSAPFDRGGSWLHSAEINPLSEIAKANGFEFHKKPWSWNWVTIDDYALNDKEVAEYTDYLDLMWDRIVEVGKKDNTVDIASILPESRWRDTAKLFIAQMLGGDYDVTSPKDMANYADSDGDWLVGGGLGEFIRYLHSDVDVVLNCAVSKIDYSGPLIRVETPKGIVEAKHVILTVSVGVLAAEKIEFVPALPNWKSEAINKLPNGLLNKVGIEFDPDWKEASEGFALDYHTGGEEYCSVAFRFYDSELATGFTAGRFAARLEADGPGTATDFCMEALRATFGNDVTKFVRKTSETHWNGNTHTFGSYSYALPGCTIARETLAKPLDKKIFFAGEATMPNAFATVHGAYLSGKEAVKRLLEVNGNTEQNLATDREENREYQ